MRHWKTEIIIGNLEMLSGRGKKEYAKEAQAVAATGEDGLPSAIASETNRAEEALVASSVGAEGRGSLAGVPRP